MPSDESERDGSYGGVSEVGNARDGKGGAWEGRMKLVVEDVERREDA